MQRAQLYICGYILGQTFKVGIMKYKRAIGLWKPHWEEAESWQDSNDELLR